jgi:leukotriene-A4 hydrolase
LDLNVTYELNPEIGQRWFPLTITLKYQQALDKAHHFVSYQGRLKYLQPVYRALVNSGSRPTAYQWFIENINFYHPIAIDSIRAIVLSTAPSQNTIERLQYAIRSGSITM